MWSNIEEIGSEANGDGDDDSDAANGAEDA
jgi:hypothetical protein